MAALAGPPAGVAARGARRLGPAALTLACSALVGALLAPVVLVATSAPAAAYPSSVVTFTGHGWGDGIGMGQWGALGYALGQDGGAGNWTYQQIVDHYYAATTLTTIPSSTDAQTVRIALTENDDDNVVVSAPGGVTVPGTQSTATAVALVQTGATWEAEAGPGCGGPFTPAASGLAEATTSAVGGGVVTVCMATGDLTVDGSITALYNSDGQARTVNTVGLEQYVADTVPGESPAYWGTLGSAGPQGQDWGFQELEAQAVAVRSYVLSDPGGYGGYADTCDLTCQTYRGTEYQNSLTDLAASDTAGQVMEEPSGAVAVTEYSASTGGYTAGDQFPVEADAGDAVCVTSACNPNHDWTASIPVSAVEAQWPQIGTLSSLTVTSRDGYGDWGGRVLTITVAGNAGELSLPGDEFADDLGLKSDWFTITSNPSGGVGGYLLGAADGGIFAFGNATFDGSMGGHPLNQPVVGIAATPGGAGYWEVASDGGIFSFGNARFYGSMGGRPLNRPVVGMAATGDGGGYWEVASDGGIFTFGDARFYGSTGAMTLNQPVVGMAPTPDGGGYWLVASDGGIFAFGDARFYGSTGDLRLVQPVVGMAPTPDGGGYWLVAADGGIFAFGDAQFFGSAAGSTVGAGTVGIVATADGDGYLTVTDGGQVTAFGDAPQFGDLTTALSSYSGQVVGMVTTPASG